MDLRFIFDKDLVKRVFKITFPMIITELAHSVFSITDTYFIKGLGAHAIAGVGLASYLFMIFMVILAVFNSGLTIFIAQAYGARELIKARKCLGEVLIYGSLLGLLISLIGYFTGFHILVILNGEINSVVYSAYDYFRFRVLGLSVALFTGFMDSTLIAIGLTSKTMKANLIGVFSNIILDPILIYGYIGIPAMGVVGAAVATVFSNIFVGVINLYYLLSIGFKPILVLKARILIKILDLGIPVGIERTIFSIGNNIYVGIIARCGSVALAAHNIGLRVESLIYMPGFAFSLAASALVGQAIGRSDYSYAKRIGRETIKTATLFMTLLGLIVALTSRYIVEPFSPDQDIQELASIYLILAGLSEAGLALAMSSSGAIRGAGSTRVPLLVNTFSFYATRLLVATVLVKYIGVIGAWIGMFIDVYIRGLMLYLVFEKYFEKICRKVV